MRFHTSLSGMSKLFPEAVQQSSLQIELTRFGHVTIPNPVTAKGVGSP